MSSIAISSIVFACVFGGALLGMISRAALPREHLSAESQYLINLGMGLVGTMAALVLGLLIASAKASYDTQNTELTEMSAKIAFLDRVLAYYGPETKEARDLLRRSVARILDQMSSGGRTSPSHEEPTSVDAEVVYEKIQELSPKDDAHRMLQGQALSVAEGVGQTRWLMYEQGVNSVTMPLLVVLIFWLTTIFISFGLFAPPNATVVTSLFISALSVSGAILMILELYTPYAGLIRISSAPLRAALAHLGQ
jgi:hypothetical protein